MHRIFVSYRRSDSQADAGRIGDRLIAAFGRDHVFKDVDSIPPGADFRAHLNTVVSQCQAVLAIVGAHWMDAQDEAGARRLDNPDDFVRIELEAALARGVSVIPVLVSNATMPTEAQLPPSLSAFAYRQAIPVRPDPDFHRDVDRLTDALQQMLHLHTAGVAHRTSAPARAIAVGVTESSTQMIVALLKRHRGGLAAVAALLVLSLAGALYAWAHRASTSLASLSDLQVIQLTTSGNAERPAISPDGKYVAYVQHEMTGDSLWIRQALTASNVEIVPLEGGTRILGATVTPDGSFVDFVRAPQGQVRTLWRVPFLGGSPKRLIDDIWSSTDWAPNGQQFAFVRTNNATGLDSLIVAGPDGGSERALVSRRRPARLNSQSLAFGPSIHPAWSPDGRVVALYGRAGDDGLQSQVVFVDVVSSTERAVSLPASAITAQGLAWLDSEWLMVNYPAQEGTAAQLWRLSSSNGRLSRLTNDLSAYAGISLSSDRTALATMRSDTRISIWVGDRTASAGTDVVAPQPFVESVSELTVGWVGERVVYTSTITGRPTIMSLATDQDRSEDVAPNGLEGTGTSDGHKVVFTSAEDGSLWTVGADGRQPKQLVLGSTGLPAISPDDRFVIFLARRSGVQSPWMVSIDGGEATQVTSEFVGRFDISPDGKSIVFRSTDPQGRAVIVVCNLPACASRRTLPPLPGAPRWTPEGGLAYTDDATHANIWVQSVDGARPQQLTHFTDGRRIAQFSWSHDGKRLAVARSTTTNDIVLFKGLKK